jgi:hypothetical protein
VAYIDFTPMAFLCEIGKFCYKDDKPNGFFAMENLFFCVSFTVLWNVSIPLLVYTNNGEKDYKSN